MLGTFNDLVGVAEFADGASLSCGLHPVVIGHAFGACSFVRPPEIVGASFNGTGALDWIGSSLVFTFLEFWFGTSLVFMCLYWLWIKLRDTEQNTAKLLIAASQSAERYRQACATAALWRERAITAQDCAAAEAQRTFTLIRERECAERSAAAAKQHLAIECAGRARAAAAAERAAVEASAATAELAAVKANAAAAERAAAKVRREASAVLAYEPIERKRAERAVAANDAAHQRSYSLFTATRSGAPSASTTKSYWLTWSACRVNLNDNLIRRIGLHMSRRHCLLGVQLINCGRVQPLASCALIRLPKMLT